MEFPEFFAAAPRIAVRDPLAKLLGATADGVIEYQFVDVVKLAGHSCPRVASAYPMTLGAPKALYPDALPVRGETSPTIRTLSSFGADVISDDPRRELRGATHRKGKRS